MVDFRNVLLPSNIVNIEVIIISKNDISRYTYIVLKFFFFIGPFIYIFLYDGFGYNMKSFVIFFRNKNDYQNRKTLNEEE